MYPTAAAEGSCGLKAPHMSWRCVLFELMMVSGLSKFHTMLQGSHWVQWDHTSLSVLCRYLPNFNKEPHKNSMLVSLTRLGQIMCWLQLLKES